MEMALRADTGPAVFESDLRDQLCPANKQV